MDPYVIPVLDPPPDAVTVSNFHETHSMTGPYVGKSEIFFGVTQEGKPNAIDEKFGKLRVASFPQVDGDENHPFVLNTIHVFQAGGICVAHFGNARFGPSPGQIRALGKIHVLLLPIDGSFTVPHDVAAKIVKRIGPNIVISDALLRPRIDRRVRKGPEGGGDHASPPPEGDRTRAHAQKTAAAHDLRGVARCQRPVNLS